MTIREQYDEITTEMADAAFEVDFLSRYWSELPAALKTSIKNSHISKLEEAKTKIVALQNRISSL